MNVKQLKELLSNMSDESEIVVDSGDHEYRRARATKQTALFDTDCINQDYGEDTTPEKEYGKRRAVLLVS